MRTIHSRAVLLTILFLPLLLMYLSTPAHAAEPLSRGQTIYVPAYSHIYSGNRDFPFPLTVTVSIRNIDPVHPIRINRVDYYETQGKLQKELIQKPIKLNPMASARYIIPQKDKSGGSGANFIVVWESDQPVNPPIAESIMIGTQSTQGISFTSRGRVIHIPNQK